MKGNLSDSIRVIEASGSPFNLGFEIGTQCRDFIEGMVEDCRQELKKRYNLDWNKAKIISRKYLSYCEDILPLYVKEIEGYAKGAGLNLDDVFTLFCDYESEREINFGCTDLVASSTITREKNVLMAHNEDFYSKDKKYLCLVRGKPEDAPDFLTVTYGGIIFNAGLNSEGIGFGGNALSPNDTRVGLPVDLVFRAMYSSKTIVEAITYANLSNRASSYNNIVGDKNGEIYSVEGSATDFELIYGEDGYLVHTNHYLTEKMKKYESNFRTMSSMKGYMCSVARYNRAFRLLRESKEISIEILKKILGDHANYPCSICRHIDEGIKPEDRVKTVFSSILDLSTKEIWLCYGNPCLGEYKRYSL